MNYLGPSLRRKPRRTRPWLKATVAVAVSLVVNAVALLTIPVGGIVGSVKPGTPPRDVVLAPLSRSQWERNRGGLPPAATASRSTPPPVLPPLIAPPPPPEPVRAPGQVVDIGPSKNETPPKDSRFVAEHDSSVEKETRSRHRGPGYQNTLPKPASPGATGRPDEAQVQGPPRVATTGEGREGKPGAPGQAKASATPPRAAQAAAEKPKEDKLALRTDQLGDLRVGPGQKGAAADAPRSAPATPATPPDALGPGGEAGGGGKPLSAYQLRPSAAQYDRLAGGPAPDKLDGVEEGEGTFLNARAWKYAGYFNRIKRQLQSEWDPQASMAARDPNGSRFGDRDWVTVVTVRLDDKGALKDVQVRRASGLDFLDRLATDAFRRAQPFSNPPHGLAVDGEIAFEFGFHVEIGAGRGLAGVFRPSPGD